MGSREGKGLVVPWGWGACAERTLSTERVKLMAILRTVICVQLDGSYGNEQILLLAVFAAGPSQDILLYPGELMAFHDVTSVVATPTALRAILQCLSVVSVSMLSRLRRLLGRENGEHQETIERQKEAGVQSQEAAMETSTHPSLLTKKQVKKEMERLNRELQLMTNHRNDLRDRLLFITEGNVEKRPAFIGFFAPGSSPDHRPNPFYKKLKTEHKEIMEELQSLQNKNTKASEKLDDLAKETGFYRGGKRSLAGPYYTEGLSSGLHSRLLMEQTTLKKKVDMLRQENKKQMEDWFLLKHHLRELKLICKKQKEKTSDLQTKQKEFQRLEENLQILLKQKEMLSQEKDLAEKVQHHFEIYQMRSEKFKHELEQATAQDESLLQKELLTQEPPADLDPEQILNSGDAFSSLDFISYV
ncbi:disks large homolog 5 [Phodopus roborovskii]|uniref:disks large homolog 5 n=1 Tax=Phodopus roborovskii TaxID=109678 RepID=UPI0021E374EB|nr:disks large homolog 5 [Phodopus roborovskii]